MTLHCGTLEMGEGSNPGYWRTEYSSYANSGVWGAYVYFTNGVSNQYIDIKCDITLSESNILRSSFDHNIYDEF